MVNIWTLVTAILIVEGVVAQVRLVRVNLRRP
jgi:hypothetical protein